MQSEWLAPALGWEDFWAYFLLLGFGYLLLKFVQLRLEAGGIYFAEADHAVRSVLRVTLLVLDPLMVLTLAALFVAVWPLLHGLIIGLIVLFAFRPIRDYVAGHVLRFDQHARIGKHLIHPQGRGVINDFGLTGLYVQQEDGRRRIAYHQLVSEGYTVAIDASVPAYYHLLISWAGSSSENLPELPGTAILPTFVGRRDKAKQAEPGPENLEEMVQLLRNRLVESPYVRRGFAITPHASESGAQLLDLDVGLHRGDHVRHLIRQLREAGFEASLVNR